jgi:hypothetical protein
VSWSLGYDGNWQRDIGYGVPAYCDQPGCDVVIDRGLSYVCGNAPYGGERGCGLFFCGEHMRAACLCERCIKNASPFEAKPDHPTWIQWKLNDGSWQQWRDENPGEVARLRAVYG